MEEKEIEFHFKKKYIEGDSILQLKDGKLLFYYFIGGYNIYLYNQKTFQKLYELDIDKLIEVEFDEEEDDDNDEENLHKFHWSNRYSENYKDKMTIKELDNDLILIGYNKYLIEINSHEKNISSKIVKKFKENILDIIELFDKRLIIIANDNIKEVIKEKEKYVIKNKYPFEDKWKMKRHHSRIDIEYRHFQQHFCSIILPNDKLLLNNISSELFDYTGCLSHPTEELTFSKIIFIDLKNFKEILSTETFNQLLKCILLENVIVIQAYKDLLLYDINSFQSIKKIKLEQYYNFFNKLNKKYLIALSQQKISNNIEIFKIENNDLIKVNIVQKKFDFSSKYRWSDYLIDDYNNNPILMLKDKRILILFGNKLYILKFNKD